MKHAKTIEVWCRSLDGPNQTYTVYLPMAGGGECSVNSPAIDIRRTASRFIFSLLDGL